MKEASPHTVMMDNCPIFDHICWSSLIRKDWPENWECSDTLRVGMLVMIFCCISRPSWLIALTEMWDWRLWSNYNWCLSRWQRDKMNQATSDPNHFVVKLDVLGVIFLLVQLVLLVRTDTKFLCWKLKVLTFWFCQPKN